MNTLINSIRLVSQTAGQGLARTRIGTVTSYDPNTYSAKVLLQPEGVEIGWLPITSAWSGNGWGLFSPPTSGDTVQLEFQEASMDAGLIVGRFYSDQARPLPAPSGELWAVHKNGAQFKLLNSGAAVFSDGHGASITLNGDGSITSAASSWNHSGTFKLSGDATISGKLAVSADASITGKLAVSGDGAVDGKLTVAGDVRGAGVSLRTHTHPGVQSGPGMTGAPV
ncbi:phage baseplate assembly protein V [Duganella sp. HH105]|uniref:phage baseplate assembly protein V n=1 Tax=Duganella sp. HH105 TaxID=1781067 RepID=UPI000877B0E4|nr:phage baseplate assembly protein V [Duganella sp. HH105]OEZ60706.1 phage-related baseplate assembly protein [Duganella sp. HH105]